MVEGGKQQLWWTREELREASKAAKGDAKEFRNRNIFTKGLDDGWRQAYGITIVVREENELEQYLIHVKANFPLVQWCNHIQTRRGLEKWTSKMYCHSRIKAITSCQAVAGKLDDADKICRISERGSRASRVFARMMGAADAVAAANIVSEDAKLRTHPTAPTLCTYSYAALDPSTMHSIVSLKLVHFLQRSTGTTEHVRGGATLLHRSSIGKAA